MNKVFEKILERLEEKKQYFQKFYETDGKTEEDENINKATQLAFDDAKSIVQEVAEEYKDGWIPCSERLPEKNNMYLCTQNAYDLATNKKIIMVSTELVEFYNGKWRRATNLVITHWQPLPEPYKERENNG